VLELVGLVLGLGLGVILGLTPGMHPALVLALLVTVLPAPMSVTLVVAAAGVGLYTRHLSQVYAPCSQELASAEPALKLASRGDGELALRVMVSATDTAMLLVGFLSLVVLVASGLDVNLPKMLNTAMGPLGIIVICLWLVSVIARSPKLTTLVGIAAVAGFGYVVLHSPAMIGDRYQLAPMMVGLFTIPIGLQLLTQTTVVMPPSSPRSVALAPSLSLLGAGLGACTGFLAGLGSGSLVSMLQSLVVHEDETTETAGYLLLASAAATANDLLAVLLVLVAGMGRSGEAVALGSVCDRPSTMTAALVMGTGMAAALIGRKLVFALEADYTRMMVVLGSRAPAILVIALGLLQLLCCSVPVVALALAAAGTALGLWLKSVNVPQQVAFASLALPLVIQWGGLVPWCNSVLF